MIPESWRNLTYDQYRKIWFDGRNAIFEGSDAPLRVDLFPPGLYFPRPVGVNVVEGNQARPVLFDMGVFDTTDKFPDVEIDDTLGFSGLRLRAETVSKGVFQEYSVFQGASYFRAIGTGQIYGLSARGLALKTGDPAGEEFSDFTDMTHVGIGPLTSMFLFDDTMRQRFDDFRPAVHDSDGLLIRNGAGEEIWRPLSNPKTLQISAFADMNPRGFGLMQRARRFGDFNDLEALYHRRPGLWVTPKNDWGRGSVTLVEIPADLEIYDNIVAYWRPTGTIQAGEDIALEYDLAWGTEPELNGPLRVLNTAMGSRPEGGRIVTIDFEDGPDVPDDLNQIVKLVRASAGTVTEGIVQRNPETGGPRLAFTFDAGDAPLVEFRAQLRLNGNALSEVWLYRWTA